MNKSCIVLDCCASEALQTNKVQIMPPRRVLPSRHARTGIISYSDTLAVTAVPTGEGEVGTGDVGETEYSTYLSDDENGDDIDEVSS